MTRDEFEQQYADRSGVTVEWLHSMDMVGLPCNCGQDDCQGFQMAHITKRILEYSICSDGFHSLLLSEGESLCLVCRKSLK